MRRIALFGIALLCFTALEAHAATPRFPGFPQVLMGETPQIPAAWSGIWETTDSVYDCADPPNLIATSTRTDTLCAGSDYSQELQGFELTCTGSADDNSAQLSCSGLVPYEEGCDLQFTMETQMTLSGQTAFSVAQISAVPVPEGCIPFALCQIIRSHMFRTGPEPKDCALTPVRSTTWGQVKSIYR